MGAGGVALAEFLAAAAALAACSSSASAWALRNSLPAKPTFRAILGSWLPPTSTTSAMTMT